MTPSAATAAARHPRIALPQQRLQQRHRVGRADRAEQPRAAALHEPALVARRATPSRTTAFWPKPAIARSARVRSRASSFSTATIGLSASTLDDADLRRSRPSATSSSSSSTSPSSAAVSRIASDSPSGRARRGTLRGRSPSAPRRAPAAPASPSARRRRRPTSADLRPAPPGRCAISPARSRIPFDREAGRSASCTDRRADAVLAEALHPLGQLRRQFAAAIRSARPPTPSSALR